MLGSVRVYNVSIKIICTNAVACFYKMLCMKYDLSVITYHTNVDVETYKDKEHVYISHLDVIIFIALCS